MPPTLFRDPVRRYAPRRRIPCATLAARGVELTGSNSQQVTIIVRGAGTILLDRKNGVDHFTFTDRDGKAVLGGELTLADADGGTTLSATGVLRYLDGPRLGETDSIDGKIARRRRGGAEPTEPEVWGFRGQGGSIPLADLAAVEMRISEEGPFYSMITPSAGHCYCYGDANGTCTTDNCDQGESCGANGSGRCQWHATTGGSPAIAIAWGVAAIGYVFLRSRRQ